MNREHVVLLDRSGYDLYRHPDGRPFLDPARYRVTLLTHSDKLGADRPGEVETVVPTDVLDERAVMAALPRIAAGPRVDHVVAVSERLLVAAGRFRDALGVPGFTERQIEVLRDKAVMKRHVAAHGIRVPEFTEIARPLDAAPLLARHGSVILKPLLSMGSVGVHHVTGPDQLRALDAAGFAVAGPYEAEEFIDGDLIHIDSVVDAGRPVVAVASRYLDDNRSFPTGGQCRSAVLDPAPARDLLLEFNERVLATLGWFSGVTHLEVFLGRSGKPVLCEIAGRPGGGGIVPAFLHRFGVDLNWVAALPQLGRPLPELREVQPPERRATGWSVIYPPALGTVRSFDPYPEQDWLVRFTRIRKAGEVLRPSASFGQGVAVATVCGPDAATVTRRLDRVRAGLPLRMEPEAADELVPA